MNIWINTTGNKISEFLNDSYSLVNTLVHENGHKNQNIKNVNMDTPKREIEAINSQMNHSSYKGTTKDYPKNTLRYLINNIKDSRMNDKNIQKIIDKANSLNKNYKITFERYGTSGDSYQLKIIDK